MTHVDLTAEVLDNPHHAQSVERSTSEPTLVVVHTSESAEGATVRGLGAWIASRTDPGSYHEAADPNGDTASYVDISRAAAGSRRYRQGGIEVNVNARALHVACVYRAAAWGDDPEGESRMIAALAARVRALVPHLLPLHRVDTPLQRGALAHAQTDPQRRTDPGGAFPWPTFLGLVNGVNTMTDAELTAEIRQAYIDLAGRDADPAGLAYWRERLRANPTDRAAMREGLAVEGLKRMRRQIEVLTTEVGSLRRQLDAGTPGGLPAAVVLRGTLEASE